MRISFDLDGVLYEKPALWSTILHALRAAGHEVGVLSGHHHNRGDRVRARLVELGFPSIDFFFGRREEDLPYNGAKRKSEVIKEHGIDIHFDDYDFDYPETAAIFARMGAEDRIIRVRSAESGKLG